MSLVATRFHRVGGKCKLKTRTHMGKLAPTWENSHPHGKTCTYNSRKPGSEPVEDQIPGSLVATRFHLVGGKCKLKTRTHRLKTCSPRLLWRQDLHRVGEVHAGSMPPRLTPPPPVPPGARRLRALAVRQSSQRAPTAHRAGVAPPQRRAGAAASRGSPLPQRHAWPG